MFTPSKLSCLKYLAPSLVVLNCVLVANSSAQPKDEYSSSVEWTVAESHIVAIGTIESLEDSQLTLRVTETLKGPKQESILATMNDYSSNPDYGKHIESLKQNKTEVLIFFDLEFQAGNPVLEVIHHVLDFHYQGHPIHGHALPFFTPDEAADEMTGILSMNLQQIKGYDDLLEITRAAIRDAEKLKPYYDDFVEAPIESFTDFGGRTMVRVPVDARLEALAKQWLQSDKDYLKLKGTNMLRHFPSRANLALLNETFSQSNSAELHEQIVNVRTEWPNVVESLEWMAIDSPLVVTGTIDEIVPEDRLTFKGDVEIKLRVKETLKGNAHDTVTFSMFMGHATQYLNRWKEEQCDVLVFLVHPKPSLQDGEDKLTYFGREYSVDTLCAIIADDRYWNNRWSPDWPPSMDISVSKHSDLVSRTRQAIAEFEAGNVRAGLPAELRFYPQGFSAKSILVPIGPSLEALARKMLRSEIEPLCINGLDALKCFPSAENQEFLKELSGKPTTSDFLKVEINNTLGLWEYYDTQVTVTKLVKDLGTVVEHPQHYIFEVASDCETLGKRGAAAAEAIPVLKELANCNHSYLSRAAQDAIAKIEADLKASEPKE